jgi:hypothetical protein
MVALAKTGIETWAHRIVFDAGFFIDSSRLCDASEMRHVEAVRWRAMEQYRRVTALWAVALKALREAGGHAHGRPGMTRSPGSSAWWVYHALPDGVLTQPWAGHTGWPCCDAVAHGHNREVGDRLGALYASLAVTGLRLRRLDEALEFQIQTAVAVPMRDATPVAIDLNGRRYWYRTEVSALSARARHLSRIFWPEMSLVVCEP